MTIGLTIAIIVGLLLGMIAGYLRDLQRALVALAGTFLGASLVDFWAANWGQVLAKRFGSENLQGWTLAVSLALFVGSVVLIGYGGGALIGPRKREKLFIRQIEAALIGLLNGALAMGFVLRFVASDKAQRDAILGATLPRMLYNNLPFLVLIIASTIAVLALLNGVFRLFRRKPVAPLSPLKATKPSSTMPPSTIPSPIAPPFPVMPVVPPSMMNIPKPTPSPQDLQLREDLLNDYDRQHPPQL